MKVYQVNLRPEALDDIRDIAFSIATLTQSDITVRRYMDALARKMHRIGLAPFGARVITDAEPYLRAVVFRRVYRIVYEVADGWVVIVAIRPARMPFAREGT